MEMSFVSGLRDRRRGFGFATFRDESKEKRRGYSVSPSTTFTITLDSCNNQNIYFFFWLCIWVRLRKSNGAPCQLPAACGLISIKFGH